MSKLVRLVLADAHPVLAEGLGMILAAEADFAVCGVAHDGCGVVELAAVHRPTVLLLDAHLLGGDPAQTLPPVQQASPATKVLLLSAHARGNTVAAALAVGAAGVVAKGGSSRQLNASWEFMLHDRVPARQWAAGGVRTGCRSATAPGSG